MKTSRRILFVENDEDFRLSYSEFLEKEGYLVVNCKNSDDCKQAIEEGLEWDIAIVDKGLDMRGWDDGGELIRYLHELKNGSPIIAISGDENYRLTPGATILLMKPFSPDKLVDEIKKFDYLFS